MPRRPDPLSDRIYRILRERLGDDGYAPGAPVIEAALVREFDVSRTPVREALSRLAAERLIEPEGTGYRVPMLALRDVREIFEIRRRLEPPAFRDVVSALSPQEAAAFADRLAAAMADAPAGGRGHHALRAVWTERMANLRLVRLMRLFEDQVAQVRLVTLRDPAAVALARDCGAALVAAARGRDPAAAEAAMQAYLDAALRCYEASAVAGHAAEAADIRELQS